MLKRTKRIAIGLAVVVGAILRFYHIGVQSFWFDEGYSAWAIDHRPLEIVRLIRADTSPPLYYLLLHEWSEALGRSEIALRGMSAVLGVATMGIFVGACYRVLRCWTATAAATWLFAISFMQVEYSQEARGYALLSFCVMAAFYGVVRYLETARIRWLLLVIGASLAGVYTNNFMLVYLAALAVAAVVLDGPMALPRRMKAGGIIAICVGAAYLPWVGALITQTHRVEADFWIARPTLDDVCNLIARLCGVAHFWSWDHTIHWMFGDVAVGLPRLVAVGLFVGLALGIGLLRGAKRKALVALGICALGPPLVVMVYSLVGRPILLPAAFVPSTGFVAMLVGGSITWASSRIGRASACVLALVLLVMSAATLWGFEREQAKEDWRGAASYVRGLPQVGSRLIVFVANEGELPFDYYYRARAGELETGAPGGFFDIDPPRTQRRVLRDADVEKLREVIQSRAWDEILFVESHEQYADPDGRTLKLIETWGVQSAPVSWPEDGKPLIVIWRSEKR